MNFFRLKIKNIFLFRLCYSLFFSIIPSGIIYGYELCQVKKDCFYNKKFNKEISFKNKLKDTKSSNNFFYKVV